MYYEMERASNQMEDMRINILAAESTIPNQGFSVFRHMNLHLFCTFCGRNFWAPIWHVLIVLMNCGKAWRTRHRFVIIDFIAMIANIA